MHFFEDATLDKQSLIFVVLKTRLALKRHLVMPLHLTNLLEFRSLQIVWVILFIFVHAVPIRLRCVDMNGVKELLKGGGAC